MRTTPPPWSIPGWLSPYIAALLLAPLLVLWRQDNSLFPRGGIDSWVYLGLFGNLTEFQRDLFPGTYYGSRLAWILPGYLPYALFATAAGFAIQEAAWDHLPPVSFREGRF